MQIIKILEISGTELQEMGCSCIVESWRQKNCGRGRRLWEAQFTEEERAKAERLYKLAYKWGFDRQHGGYPETHRMETYEEYCLLHRVATFFATV